MVVLMRRNNECAELGFKISNMIAGRQKNFL